MEAQQEGARPVAAIDLGSNSFHMVVGRPIGEQLSLIDRLRDPVRLAAGLDQEGRLDEETVARALSSLERMGQRLRDLPGARVRAIGTNTFRRAKRPRDLLRRASAALGFPIEILSGVEEARLIHLGVSQDLPRIDGRRLVVDIGGGSTELVLGQGFRPIYLDSHQMGCVTYTRTFFGDGKLTRERFRKAELAAKLELESMFRRFIERGWEEAVGSSGTIKSVALALDTRGVTQGEITLAGIKKLRKHMISAGKIKALELPELPPDRVQVLAGGLAILRAVFEKMEIESMRAVKAALREGVLYDLLGRIRQEDVRDRTIRSLSERYHVDEDHADRIQRCALRCLRQVAQSWELEDEENTQLLSWAAQLHEIGLALSFSSFHKHGAYLVENSDMPGFSRQDQQRLAHLIRSQRRKLFLSPFEELAKPWDERLPRLALLLRIAVRLNRMRSRAPLPHFRLERTEEGLAITLPEDWLNAHPLTRADLEDEALVLKSAGLRLDVRTAP
jgi:exopolyphosphatase/guanosine-5'-triphosphate,3'-diphosphate pyrophosphatase